VSSGRVHFRGIVLGPSGYAGEGRDWLRALEGAGLAPSLEGASFGGQLCELPQDDLARIHLAAGRQRAVLAPTFHHVPAQAYVADPRTQWNVLRTMFETEGIPDSWHLPLSRADTIVVPSEPVRAAFVRSGIAAEKLRVLPPPLAVGMYPRPNEHRPRSGPFKILAIGEWTARKAHDVLVAAFARAFRPGEAELWIKTSASEDAVPRLQEECARITRAHAQASAPIVRTLCATLNQDQMDRLYAACDVLAMPSRGEGWGRPVHEAMLRGIPVVATRAGSLAALLPDEAHGWPVRSLVVPVEPRFAKELPLFSGQSWHEPDPQHLGALLREVFEQPEEAQRRAQRAWHHVRSLCAPDKIVRELAEILGVTSGAAAAGSG